LHKNRDERRTDKGREKSREIKQGRQGYKKYEKEGVTQNNKADLTALIFRR
jgi:hypothetical protein